MKVIINGKTVDVKVLIISNEKNEIMITENEAGAFIITKSSEGDEVVKAYIR